MKIVVIGSGNVAFNLGVAFKKKKHTIVQVVGRNNISTQELSLVLKCPFTVRWNELNRNAELYLVAVSDNEIENVSKNLKGINGVVLHTSGSIPLSVFKGKIKNFGVLYPVQTFTAGVYDFPAQTPIVIEANSKTNISILKKLAAQISSEVVEMNSEKRLRLHLAAVLANNFSNHFFALAEKLLAENKIDYNLLAPLIRQTANNATLYSPALVQTGPAKRRDTVTLKKHFALLKEKKELLNVYRLLTKNIQSFYKK